MFLVILVPQRQFSATQCSITLKRVSPSLPWGAPLWFAPCLESNTTHFSLCRPAKVGSTWLQFYVPLLGVSHLGHNGNYVWVNMHTFAVLEFTQLITMGQSHLRTFYEMRTCRGRGQCRAGQKVPPPHWITDPPSACLICFSSLLPIMLS